MQGSTLRKTHVLLFDTRHRNRRTRESYFTMRHLIVGMSRATHGRYVHVPTSKQERYLMDRAREG